jgi:hypothetical protein
MIHHNPAELVLEMNIFHIYYFVFPCACTAYGVGMDGDKVVTLPLHTTEFVLRDLELSFGVPLRIICRSNAIPVDAEVVSERPELGL